MSNKNLEKLFQILSAVLIGIAVFFLVWGNFEYVFVFSALGSVSYFLSFRYQVKERLDQREAERLERELDEKFEDKNALPENKSLFDIEEIDIDRQKDEVLESNKV